MPEDVELRFGSGDDPGWDAFVHGAPGGHHVQTSRWAHVKAVQGWRAARVVALQGGAIAGGAQLLLRDLPVGGTLAYAPRAPLVPREPALERAVLDAVDALCARERVLYLKLQPPGDRHDLGPVLEARGYVASDLEAAPVATVRVDVTRPDDELLAAMRTTTRANVRKAQRRGLTVREGGAADLAAFQRVIEATAARQHFHAYPASYYGAMWEAFAPGGHAGLLLVEDGAEPVSAALLIGYGDTVLYKMGGWTGGAVSQRPNERMHWAAFAWTRERGYRWYDFEGIKPHMARAVQAGDVAAVAGTDGFKLGWGGEIALFPGAYDRSPHRLAAPLVRRIAPRLDSLRGIAHRLLGRGS